MPNTAESLGQSSFTYDYVHEYVQGVLIECAVYALYMGFYLATQLSFFLCLTSKYIKLIIRVYCYVHL